MTRTARDSHHSSVVDPRDSRDSGHFDSDGNFTTFGRQSDGTVTGKSVIGSAVSALGSGALGTARCLGRAVYRVAPYVIVGGLACKVGRDLGYSAGFSEGKASAVASELSSALASAVNDRLSGLAKNMCSGDVALQCYSKLGEDARPAGFYADSRSTTASTVSP